jgi:DNA invertase Pin-like site-specific DNA recombinase
MFSFVKATIQTSRAGTMKNSILYCRRSTKKTSSRDQQANSLEVQQSVLRQFASQNGSEVVECFVEQASGRDDSRPVFQQALSYAHENDCLLLVLRLDRLSRSLSFFSKIEESLPIIRCAQIGWSEPDFITASLLLVLACNESKMLGARVSQTMRHLKERNPDIKFGNPRIVQTAQPASLAVRKANAEKYNKNIKSLLSELESTGNYNTLKSKADRLNELGFLTRRGRIFSPSTVRRIENYA